MKERVAQDGYWLTQSSIEDEQSRTFARKVAGYGDLDSLFVEWTDEQKSAWEKEYLDTPDDFEEAPEE